MKTKTGMQNEFTSMKREVGMKRLIVIAASMVLSIASGLVWADDLNELQTLPAYGGNITTDGTALYGTYHGGVYRVDMNGGNYQTLYTFVGTYGPSIVPGQGVALRDGVLYGFTYFGDNSYDGIIYKVGTDGSNPTVIANFSQASGREAWATPTISNDGTKLYGTTGAGGYGLGYGTVFRIGTSGGYQNLYEFRDNSDSGKFPSSTLLLSPDGNTLYGTTYAGGWPNSAGTVFKISTAGGAPTYLHTFMPFMGDSTDGVSPTGSLAFTATGNEMYGTTDDGGLYGKGTIYKIGTNGSGYQKIYDFKGTAQDGEMSFVDNTLTLAQDGKSFYGASSAGIFEIGLQGGLQLLRTGYCPPKLLNQNGVLYGVSDNKLFSFLPYHVWDAGAGTANWSDATNWATDTGLETGSNVCFDGNPAIKTVNNDLTDAQLGGITFKTGGITITGNGITLSEGIYDRSTSVNFFRVPITLAADQTIYGGAGSGMRLSLDSSINLGDHTLTIDSNTSGTMEVSNISGTGGVIKEGSGSCYLSYDNTYSGPTIINAGTLKSGRFGATAGFSDNSPITINGGGTLWFDVSDHVYSVAGNGKIALTNYGAIAVDAPSMFSGSIELSGYGVGYFANNAPFTTGAANMFKTGVQLFLNSDLILNDNDQTLQSVQGSGNIHLGSADLIINGGALSGSIDGTGHVTYQYTTALSGENTYTGGTTLNGDLSVSHDNAIPAAGGLIVAGGALHVADGVNATVGGLVLESGLLETPYGGTQTGKITAASYDLQSGAVNIELAGDTSLDKTTGGAVTLYKANSYTGATNVQEGTLIVTEKSLAQRDVANDGLLSIQCDTPDNYVYGGNIGGAGSLEVNNYQTGGYYAMTLAGTNTYGGSTFIDGAGVTLGSAAALPSGGAVTVVNGGRLNVNGNAASVDSLTLSGWSAVEGGEITASSQFNLNSGLVYAQLKGDTAPAYITGEVQLLSANTYGGGTYIEQGANVYCYAANALPEGKDVSVNGGLLYAATGTQSPNTVRLSSGGQLWGSGISATKIQAEDGLIQANLTGAGTLEKTTGGTVRIWESSDYSGATTVTEGTLFVGGGIASHTTVDSSLGTTGSAVLTGTGTVGSVTVQNGGTITAGDAEGTGVGRLTLGAPEAPATLTWNSGGRYAWKVSDASSSAGPWSESPGWDFLNINGTLDIQATAESPFTIAASALDGGSGTLNGFSSRSSNTWTIASATSGITIADPKSLVVDTTNFTVPFLGTFSAEASGNDLLLRYTYISDPNYTLLHSFAGPVGDGANPTKDVTIVGDRLYGMTCSGGENYAGVIFSIGTSGDPITIEKSFNGYDGASPFGNLTADGTMLYGMTSNDNNTGYGVVFSYDSVTGSYNQITALDYNTTGSYPSGSLTKHGEWLYGTTADGGANYQGTIFRVNALTGVAETVYAFDSASGNSGGWPMGGNATGDLIISQDGRYIFGANRNGGQLGGGTIYRLDTQTGILTVLKDFDSSAAPFHPSVDLFLDGDKLYGVTDREIGGDTTVEAIFSIGAMGTGSDYSELYRFAADGSEGKATFGGLTMVDGVLYGMASGLAGKGGIPTPGLIYQYDTATGLFSVVYRFEGAPGSGSNPVNGSLVASADGSALYGMTYYGGEFDQGTIFSYLLPQFGLVWNGGSPAVGGDNNFSTAANWKDGVVPVDGVTLTFSGTVRQTPHNDLGSEDMMTFEKINFKNGGFTLDGNGVILNKGIVNIAGDNTVALSTIVINSDEAALTSNSGTLTVDSSVELGSYTLTVNGTGASVINGVISGDGGLTKEGAGTATLEAANTFTGATTVSAGVLAVNGSIADTSSTTVTGTGTLSGSGEVARVSVGAGGTLAPGNGAGSITISDWMEWHPDGRYAWQVTDTVGTAGVAWDLINLEGVLTAYFDSNTDPFTIAIGSLGAPVANFDKQESYEWTILTAQSITAGLDTSAFAFDTTGLVNSIGNGTFEVQQVGNDLKLVYNAATIVSRTWNGGSDPATGNDNISTPENWDGGVAPSDYDALVFAGSTRTMPYFDVSGNTYESIEFANGGFTLIGNVAEIALESGIVNTAGDNEIALGITLGADQSFVNNGGVLTFSGIVDTNGKNLTVDGAGETVVSGAITGGGGLTKAGEGALRLLTENSYAGPTNITAGELCLENNQNPIDSGSAITVAPGASLRLKGVGTWGGSYWDPYNYQTVYTGTRFAGPGHGAPIYSYNSYTQELALGSLDGEGSVILDGTANSANQAVRVGINGGDQTLASSFVEADPEYFGTLIKEGAGNITLTGTNTQLMTWVVDGTLTCGSAGAIAADGFINLADGTVLDLNNQVSTIGSISGGESSELRIGDAGLTLGGDGLAGYVDESYGLVREAAYGGVISGNGGLTKDSNTVTTLMGQNTYAGPTVINQGILLVNGQDVIPDGSAVEIASGASMNIQRKQDGWGYFYNYGARSNTYYRFYQNTYNPVSVDDGEEKIGSLSGGGDVVLGGNCGNQGLRVGGNNGSTIFSGAIRQADPVYAYVWRYDENTGQWTQEYQLVPDIDCAKGYLVKEGTGNMTMTGTSTYTGTTTVAGGTLTVDGSIADSEMTTVGLGAVLAGTGTVGAAEVLENGTIAAGGVDPGTLTMASLTWNGGGHYLWNIDGSSAGLLDIAGELTLNSNEPLKLNIDIRSLTSGVFGSSPNSWTIAQASSISGFAADKFAFTYSGLDTVGLDKFSLKVDNIDTPTALILEYAGVYSAPQLLERPVVSAADQQGGGFGGAFIDVNDNTLKYVADFGDPGSAVPVEEDPGVAFHPAVSNGEVLYRKADGYYLWTSAEGSVKVFDGAMPVYENPNDPNDKGGVCAIYNGTMVVEGAAGLFYKKPGESTWTNFAAGSANRHPSVAGDKVVLEYYGDNGTKSLLKMFNLSTGDWDNSDIGWADIEVDINYGENLEGACPWLAYDEAGGYYVAWQGWNADNEVWNLFYWSSGDPETIMNLTELMGTDDGAGKYYSDMYPVLDTTGWLVGFQRLDDWDIYEYSLDTGILTPVSATSGVDEMYPTISGGGQVAWGNYDPATGEFQGVGFEQDGGGEVPEPSTLLLLLPLIGFGIRRIRKAKNA